MTPEYLFIIDTQQYAGNFERELVAYITGYIGDCGVGKEFSKRFISEVGEPEDFFSNITMVSDNGCYRPTEIYTTPGYFNHGHGGIFKDGQEDIALEHYKRVAIEYKEKYLNLQKDILKKLEAGIKVSSWTIKACKRDIKRYEDEIKKIKKVTKTPKGLAYCSVAIYFCEKPTDSQIRLMKDRAKEFFKENYSSNQVTGFRLIKQSIQTVEESI